MEKLADISCFESLVQKNCASVFNAIPSQIRVQGTGQLAAPPKTIMADKRGYKQFVQMLLSAVRQLRAAGFDDNQIMSLVKQSNTGVNKTGLPSAPAEDMRFNLGKSYQGLPPVPAEDSRFNLAR